MAADEDEVEAATASSKQPTNYNLQPFHFSQFPAIVFRVSNPQLGQYTPVGQSRETMSRLEFAVALLPASKLPILLNLQPFLPILSLFSASSSGLRWLERANRSLSLSQSLSWTLARHAYQFHIFLANLLLSKLLPLLQHLFLDYSSRKPINGCTIPMASESFSIR